jgi:carboxyl-terminal processing protease
MSRDDVLAIWKEIRLAVLLLASAWIGLIVIGRVEWVTILCGGALIVHMWAKARAARATQLLDSAICAFGIALAAAFVMASAFDLVDLGRGSDLGDWDTGFLFGVALLLPIALAYALLMVRERLKIRSNPEEDSALPAEEESSRGAMLILVSICTTLITADLLGQGAGDATLLIMAIAGSASIASALVYRWLTHCEGSAAQFVIDIAACLAISYGLRSFSIAVMLGMFTLAYAGFWVTNRLASSGPMTIGEACIRFLGGLRYGVVTATVICGTLVGMAAALTARADITVAGLVSILDEAMPLSGNGFANLIMRDEYLWADNVSRPPDLQSVAGAEGPIAMIRRLRFSDSDRWSGSAAASIYQAHDIGLRFGFGFEFASDEPGDVVAYVHSDSPADQAGVRRGWRWLEASSDVRNSSASGYVQIFEDTTGKQRRLEMPVGWQKVPLVTSRVTESHGRRVGYLLLWQFTDSVSEELDQHFAKFRQQGIEELIVDLRYNPGGSLSTAARLAALIAGDLADGVVFERLRHNARYSDLDRAYRLQSRPESLSMRRVFVLTTSGSCSASESVINGLAPHIEVVTIGGRTCGKPVGSTPKSFHGVTYSVISFRGENSRGDGDYFGGIAPKCHVAEDFHSELGVEGDPLVDAALGYMRDARCPEPGSARYAVTS